MTETARIQLGLFLLIAIPVLCFAYPQKGANDQNSNEIHQLFLADQADREGMEGGAPVSAERWKKVEARDRERRQHTRELLAAGALKTPQDFEDASFIFQHGDTPNDYLMGHTLAILGIEPGKPISRWIAAATLDRYLQSIKQQQVFGTQYFQQGTTPYTQQPYDRTLLDDNVRKAFGVPSQAEQQKQLEEYNKARER